MNKVRNDAENNVQNEHDQKDKRNIGREPIHKVLKAVEHEIAAKIGNTHNFLLLKMFLKKKNSTQAAITNKRASGTE